LVVIGGGPAGLAAALAAWENGVRDILILERDKEAGGILNQCIHNGFGLHRFKEELTGPEYAGRFIDLVKQTDIQIRTDTMVLDLTEDRVLHTVSPQYGYEAVQAGAVVLAMGCRERTRGAISIPGARCSGIFTAGAAQRFLNIEGYMVGKRVVILGSGDIGLIMARRMTLEGARVLACVELMPYSGGLTRNIVQCLHDFDIPLYLSHTVTDIRGRDRLEQVVVSKVDERRNPIPGTEMVFDCDTLLLSVGLLPENELSRQAGIAIDPRTNGPVVWENRETSIPGVFACGNVLHVHDLVDYVSLESEQAGRAAAAYLQGRQPEGGEICIRNGFDVSYTVPQHFHRGVDAVEIFFRVRNVRKDTAIRVLDGEKQIARFKREHMAPGEMENIKIPKVLLDRITGDTLTVEIEQPVVAADLSGHTLKA
jgi:NADPH-dependent 2,4-dienoyl-CoA reductase/sulfur reductase-like enzyme